MSMLTAREREIREIAIAANSGEASDEQIARLDELIRSDRQLANYAARVLEQQASLAWQGLTGSRTSPTVANDLHERAEASSARDRLFHARSWAWPSVAVGIGFILGGLSAALVYRWNMQSSAPPVAASDSPAVTEPLYEARLVRSTACLWDGNSMGSRQV